jgi:hypothetical protein
MVKYCHITTKITDCIFSNGNSDELHHELFESLFLTLNLDFKKIVKFALIEALELDRIESYAKTWVFFEKDENAFEDLIKNYFTLIDRLFKGRNFSISSADSFYFEHPIFFSRITNQEVEAQEDLENTWFGPNVTELRRNYHSRNPVPTEDLQKSYDEYVDALSKGMLKPYRVSYILLVPVVLNHQNQDYQHKLGAVFLHFGLNEKLGEELEKRFARDVFKNINLYWHYNLTSESMYMRSKAAMEAEAKVLAKADAHKRYLNEVMPAMERLTKVVGDLDLAVAPSPKAKAAKTLLSLRRVMDKCFPIIGDLHDPWGHTTMEELQKVSENIIPLVTLFEQYIIDTEAFVDKEDLVNLLMKPIVDMLNLRENTTVTNNMNEPEPALCLAKCISGKRIPLAWILLALGHDKITASHWRLYSQFQSMQDSSSVLDVLHPLGMCVNKLTLTFKSLKVTPNSANSDVTMVLCPIWTASYQNFFESIETKRQLPSPSGGTARALFELLNCDYKLTLVHPIDKEPMILYRGDATDNPVCEIIVDSREVIFNWRMVPEPTYNSVNRNRDGEG